MCPCPGSVEAGKKPLSAVSVTFLRVAGLQLDAFGQKLFRTPTTLRFQARNKNEAVHGAKPTRPM
jgi:hypothetical protein